MQKLRYTILIVFVFMLVSSCMHDEELWQQDPLNLENLSNRGVFIINEGNFMYDNASLSYYDIENDTMYNDVFFNANALPLGDVAISMQIHGDLAYIVVNNSGKIYIINKNNFSYEGKITGLTSPRYIHFISDEKAYVSDLYARAITIVNPQTQSITGYIDLNNGESQYYQHPTEEMIQVGQYVFVNCWSYDNKILVIDSQTDALVDSITVGIQPRSMALDKNNNLWAGCDGGFQGSTYGYEEASLIKINTSTFQVEDTWTFDLEDDIGRLCMNGNRDTLFFLNKDVYCFPVESSGAPQVLIQSPYQSSFTGFNGIGVDPLSSEIYVADAKDFNQSGRIIKYNPDALPVDTLNCGVIPSYFLFTHY
ncbi:MAG: cell surface protein [Marinilabiliales bacterium]|nr:MAG: cell surface protein [Marinilabiliales bacterium]